MPARSVISAYIALAAVMVYVNTSSMHDRIPIAMTLRTHGTIIIVMPIDRAALQSKKNAYWVQLDTNDIVAMAHRKFPNNG